MKHIFRQPVETTGWSQIYFIDEAGFYELVFSSKLLAAKKFGDWVFTTVLPSIRKYGQYKLFDSPWNKMIMIGNETDLHYKVVGLMRRYYPDSILVAGLGENQDADEKRLDSYKKGYMRGHRRCFGELFPWWSDVVRLSCWSCCCIVSPLMIVGVGILLVLCV